MDRVLFDHYTNVTFKTLVQRDEDPEPWRTDVIQIAQSHPFVMHGLLTISALHLAWLNPNNGHENIILATIHQERALPIYQTAISHADQGNCHALFAFASILAVLEFAAPRFAHDLMILGTRDEGQVPAWLHLVRGGCSLLYALWPSIAQGPMKPLVGIGQGPTESLAGPDDIHLALLLPLFSSDGIVLSADVKELQPCQEALHDLRSAFSMPYLNAASPLANKVVG